jgi:uncharacterized membrane protein
MPPFDRGDAMSFTSAMDDVAKVFEGLGAVVLVAGVIWSAASAWITWRATSSGQKSYQTLRRTFGAALLLGLEILVAADLIRTVAVAPTLDNVVVLGLVVLIRTFLSFSLQVEIDGTLPWRKASSEAITAHEGVSMSDETRPPDGVNAPDRTKAATASTAAAATADDRPDPRAAATTASPVANPERHRHEALPRRDEPPS